MFLIYNALLTLLSIFWVPWMFARSRRRGEPPNWKERCGDYALEPRKDRKRVWMHAVSVGEVIASKPILTEVRRLLPDHEIVLSVTTSSGHKTAREQPQGLFDHLVYFPIDVVRFQLAAMQHVQPAVVAVMETELWMNFLWAAKVFDARTMLINGRISDRSYKPWLRFYYASLLDRMDRCLMQTSLDADRIRTLGASSADVMGNSKFDQAVADSTSDSDSLRTSLGLPANLPVVVVGSTRGPEEEAFVLKALRLADLSKFSVVHAPRHLERVPDLQKQLSEMGIKASLRSQGEGGAYVILDTYGELDSVYRVADAVVIGGGFANLGGQNLIQPLAKGKPVLHGPFMQNFRSMTEAADQAGAAIQCGTAEELASNLSALLGDPLKRRQMGEAAKNLISQNTGASQRYAQAIADEARRFHESEASD